MPFPVRTLDFFVDALRANTPFTVSRWGDGEWNSVLGKTHGKNCDGHRYFEKMGDDLRAVLLDKPAYILGIQRHALRIFKGRVEDWLATHGLTHLDWIDADVFHEASEKGELVELVKEMRQRPVMLVGPPHLEQLQHYLGAHLFVPVAPLNSYLSLDQIHQTVTDKLAAMPAGTVVSISMGMPSKLLVHRLHARWAAQHTIIDFGSVWDVYAGVVSRKYMHRMTNPVLT